MVIRNQNNELVCYSCKPILEKAQNELLKFGDKKVDVIIRRVTGVWAVQDWQLSNKKSKNNKLIEFDPKCGLRSNSHIPSDSYWLNVDWRDYVLFRLEMYLSLVVDLLQKQDSEEEYRSVINDSFSKIPDDPFYLREFACQKKMDWLDF